MIRFLGHARRPFRLRDATALVAVVAALALVATPARADANAVVASEAPTEQPGPPGEDAEVAVPDAIHSRSAPDGATPRPPGDRAARPGTRTRSPLPHVAHTRPTIPTDSFGNGMGIRLRC